MRRIWTIFFTGFALFIVTIIVLKNSGSGDWFFGLFEGIPRHDKVGHFVLMGILGFLAVAALSPCLPWRRWVSSAFVVALLLVIIAAEEWSQQLVSKRTFSGLDYWCSAAGAVSFGILAHVVIGRGDGEKGGKGA